MNRTSNTFSVLQATAVVVSIAMVLWTLGLPSFQFASAAAVTEFSNTLSDSAPGASSNHTIVFTTPTGVAAAETITLDFSDGPFVVGSVNDTDIDLATTSDYTLGSSCGAVDATAAFSGTTLTITMCAGFSIPANATTTIEIGTNATFDALGDQQLQNPGAEASYQIPLTAGSADTGETRVAIINNVTVSASVDTLLDFTVSGVANGQPVHGTTTGTTTTATEIAYGELVAGQPRTGAQELQVSTNAANGFTVTVTADGMLRSGGSDIDGFIDGAYTDTPTAWTAPTPNVSDENTWGHWGLISDDTDLFPSTETWISPSTTAVSVMDGTGPVQNSTSTVGYTVEISALQEASENYQAILTYVATPVF